jgi:hypothetical protein
VNPISSESQVLFNPALVALVLNAAALDFESKQGQGLPFALTFIVTPLALHAPFRRQLPSRASKRLAAWLRENPRVRADFFPAARAYVSITQAGLRAGLASQTLSLDGGHLSANLKRQMTDGQSSAETKAIVKKAGLLGRWMAASGDSATIFKFFGVRP